MENGSFQNLELANLDFSSEISEGDDFSFSPPPQNQSRFKTPAAMITQSETVEALIAQNEDVTARLKMTLRRMTMMEEENRHLQTTLNDLKLAHAATSDQMLVWKEKEKIWKERTEKSEKNLQEFRERFPDFLKMEAKIEKLTRYQERVKTTIKPYLQQLKDYANSLHLQIQGLNSDLDVRDAQIADKDREIFVLKEKFEDQTRFYEINQNSLVTNFENEKDFLQREITALNENLAVAEEKAQRLNAALERQDELENLVISLRRNKDEFYAQTQAELSALRSFNGEAKQTLVEKDLMIADLKKELESLKAQNISSANKQQDLEEQIASLRYMWSEQSEEKEKMQISLASLEKINLELSAKLSELRRKV